MLASRSGMLNGMPQIAIRVSEKELDFLDKAVSEGRFESRAAAVRAGLEALAREGRNREIADAYREAYEKVPPGEWLAEENTALLDDRLADAEPADRGNQRN